MAKTSAIQKKSDGISQIMNFRMELFIKEWDMAILKEMEKELKKI